MSGLRVVRGAGAARRAAAASPGDNGKAPRGHPPPSCSRPLAGISRGAFDWITASASVNGSLLLAAAGADAAAQRGRRGVANVQASLRIRPRST